MASLWAGSDVDLSTLRLCRVADRLEYRLSCLRGNHKQPLSFTGNSNASVVKENIEEENDSFNRRRRSGTWP